MSVSWVSLADPMDAYLLGQNFHLLWLQTSVGEHANLSQISIDIFCKHNSELPHLAGDV
jgi:hypothetical protein